MSIVASDLSKSYPPAGRLFPGPGRIFKPALPEMAVDHVSFSVPTGSITGLAGPNGAGKTTLLKIIAGLLPPDEGGFRLCGLNSARDFRSIRAATALADARPGSFYMRLTADENLEFFGALYGLSKELAAKRSVALCDTLNIPRSARTERFDRLSAGTAQKFSLVRALMRDFSVLLLDEPTKGLDSAAALALRGVVTRLAAEGRTIICASHDLTELAGISDRALVLKTGKLAAEIACAELKSAAALGRDALEKLFAGAVQR